ncbi:MAG: cbb3-type cytochrome oxidase assembly protein CcoS [Nitrospinae bacterium]|nr:cbb3-type cytochrome oxidase assembly protein CcoS [Nitrospinota bacterium]
MGEVTGFAVIQVITYLLIAIGFFFLFLWSFLKGDFKDMEKAKYRILEMEEKMREIERGT